MTGMAARGPLCAKHRAERSRWLDAVGSAAGRRILATLRPIPLVAIGKGSARAAADARRARADSFYGLVRGQLSLIDDACRAGRGCADSPEPRV